MMRAIKIALFYLVLYRVMEMVSHLRCSIEHQRVFVMALDPWEPIPHLPATFEGDQDNKSKAEGLTIRSSS